MEFFGKIAVIHSKYVILNEKRRIIDSILLPTLLPEDEVAYVIKDENIHLTRLVFRKRQFFMAIVSQLLGSNLSIFSYGLPKFFSPSLSKESNDMSNIKEEDVLIIEAGMNGMSIYRSYGSIRDRSMDKEIFLTLYQLNANVDVENLEYSVSVRDGYYTKPFQDLTHLYTFNVDPTQSKDFDDALSIENDKIYVHIVDAHRMIPINSEIEREAYNKSFTLYLPEHIENILPRDLAEHELSLIKGKERYVITVEYTIDDDQEIVGYEIYPSVIIIKERYDYDGFMKVLDRPCYKKLVGFNDRWETKTLKIPSVKMDIGEDGRLKGVKYENHYDKAHKIIETMMILTNLTISKHIPHGIPQRFHQKIKNTIKSIESITNNEMINAILMIKSYRTAYYDPFQGGHFGLGLSTYTHFTSPIRRYFDVIVHRLLAGYTLPNIENVLDHLNDRERFIDRNVKLYQLVKFFGYYQDIQDNNNKKYKGYIVQVVEKGVVVIFEDFLYEMFVFSKMSFTIGECVWITIHHILWSELSLSVKISKT